MVGAWRWIGLVAVFAVAGGCAPKWKVDPRAVAGGREGLYRFENTQVTLVGRAENSSNGSVILMDDGTRVGVSEMNQWPAKVKGREVTVRGVLRRLPSPRDRSRGDWFELRAIRWIPGRVATDTSAQAK